MYGGAGNDEFFLGTGDRVVGGEGDDAIFVGNGGENLITGGLGADTFSIFTGELPLLPNTITDFVGGEDVLGVGGGLDFADLTIVGIDGNTTIAAPSVFDMTPEVFAILLNVEAASISEANFVFG
ncbi:MAG: hypothetical protein HC890_07290 [Chloroflexaceae bacterium]|nr:hypothetical protein [Chloroflexaceae bacterium]